MINNDARRMVALHCVGRGTEGCALMYGRGICLTQFEAIEEQAQNGNGVVMPGNKLCSREALCTCGFNTRARLRLHAASHWLLG